MIKTILANLIMSIPEENNARTYFLYYVYYSLFPEANGRKDYSMINHYLKMYIISSIKNMWEKAIVQRSRIAQRLKSIKNLVNQW